MGVVRNLTNDDLLRWVVANRWYPFVGASQTVHNGLLVYRQFWLCPAHN